MKWRSISEFVFGIAVLGYMGTIFYFSSIPGTALRLPAPDYVLHGLAFGGFSLLVTLFLLHYMKLSHSVFVGLVITLLFALSDEAHQSFVPFRSPDWRDIAADLVGALIVQSVLILLIRSYPYAKSETE